MHWKSLHGLENYAIWIFSFTEPTFSLPFIMQGMSVGYKTNAGAPLHSVQRSHSHHQDVGLNTDNRCLWRGQTSVPCLMLERRESTDWNMDVETGLPNTAPACKLYYSGKNILIFLNLCNQCLGCNGYRKLVLQ